MKTIKLLKPENFVHTSALVKTVLESPQADGLQVADIRQRCKLLDKLDTATGDTWEVEDKDYEYLKRTVEGFKFSFANQQLLEIIDSVLNAEDAGAPAK